MSGTSHLDSQVALEAALVDTYFPLDIMEISGQRTFAAELDTRDLGWFRVTHGSLHASALRSKLSHITAHNPPQYVLQFSQVGSLRFRGPGLKAECGPNTFMLLGATRYFEIEHTGPSESIAIALPGGLLRAHMRDVNNRCFNAISADSGAAAVLRRMVLEIWDQRQALSRDDSKDISGSLVNLLRLVIPSLAAEATSHSVKARELEEVIELNLDREDLGPDLIASEMGISTSYVYTLAARQGTTVRKLILGKRLERCRMALLEPAMSHVSLTEIAFGWGFQDMSHFSRRFSERYGVSPSEFRKHAIEATSARSGRS